MGLIRRSRTVRPDPYDGRVTPRDLEILTLVGRQKVASTEQIALVFFGDRSTASRRLGRLVAMGLLKVEAPSLNAPNLYLLTKRGLSLLRREGADEASLHRGRLPAREHLEHLGALGDLHAMLLHDLAWREGISLELLLFEHDLRRLAGSPPPEYLPDLLVRFDVGGVASTGYAIEVDLAAEGIEFFVRTKVLHTLALAHAQQPLFGLERWRPVLVTSSRARLRSLSAALAAEGAGALWLVTDFDHLREHPALGPSFASAAAVAVTPKNNTPAFDTSLVPPT